MSSLRDRLDATSCVLRDVQLTGRAIGAGAYGRVEEVVVAGTVCAAKTIHIALQQSSGADLMEAEAQFAEEVQLVSTLRHPRVVQFIGVCFLPGLRLPALVMERLACSLHDLLEPIPALPVKPYIPLYLKCSVIRDVACGLAYLNRRTPPVIHRDLTARNILLDSAMVAKIADLRVARIVRHLLSAVAGTRSLGLHASRGGHYCSF